MPFRLSAHDWLHGLTATDYRSQLKLQHLSFGHVKCQRLSIQIMLTLEALPALADSQWEVRVFSQSLKKCTCVIYVQASGMNSYNWNNVALVLGTFPMFLLLIH